MLRSTQPDQATPEQNTEHGSSSTPAATTTASTTTTSSTQHIARRLTTQPSSSKLGINEIGNVKARKAQIAAIEQSNNHAPAKGAHREKITIPGYNSILFQERLKSHQQMIRQDVTQKFKLTDSQAQEVDRFVSSNFSDSTPTQLQAAIDEHNKSTAPTIPVSESTSTSSEQASSIMIAENDHHAASLLEAQKQYPQLSKEILLRLVCLSALLQAQKNINAAHSTLATTVPSSETTSHSDSVSSVPSDSTSLPVSPAVDVTVVNTLGPQVTLGSSPEDPFASDEWRFDQEFEGSSTDSSRTPSPLLFDSGFVNRNPLAKPAEEIWPEGVYLGSDKNTYYSNGWTSTLTLVEDDEHALDDPLPGDDEPTAPTSTSSSTSSNTLINSVSTTTQSGTIPTETPDTLTMGSGVVTVQTQDNQLTVMLNPQSTSTSTYSMQFPASSSSSSTSSSQPKATGMGWGSSASSYRPDVTGLWGSDWNTRHVGKYQPSPADPSREYLNKLKSCIFNAALNIAGSKAFEQKDKNGKLLYQRLASPAYISPPHKEYAPAGQGALLGCGTTSSSSGSHGSAGKKRILTLWSRIQHQDNPYTALLIIRSYFVKAGGNWGYDFTKIGTPQSGKPTLLHYLVLNFPDTYGRHTESKFKQLMKNPKATDEMKLQFALGCVDACLSKCAKDQPVHTDTSIAKLKW